MATLPAETTATLSRPHARESDYATRLSDPAVKSSSTSVAYGEVRDASPRMLCSLGSERMRRPRLYVAIISPGNPRPRAVLLDLLLTSKHARLEEKHYMLIVGPTRSRAFRARPRSI